MHKNRCWSLAFDEDLSKAVSDMKSNKSTIVSEIHKAAKILRHEFLLMKQSFSGSFSSNCEASSLPPMLRSFLHMLLDGSGINQSHPGPDQSRIVASIGQQIIYNSVKERSKDPDSIPRHKEKGTPASIYLAMNLHPKTGSASLVQTMHKRGLCVSYDRLKTLSTDLANSVISHWEQIRVVVPPQAVNGVFTIGGFDNIDHNPSSTTSASALHGSCISIQQHYSSFDQRTQNVTDILNPSETGNKYVRNLPNFYTNMELDVSLASKEVLHVPSLSVHNPSSLLHDPQQ